MMLSFTPQLLAAAGGDLPLLVFAGQSNMVGAGRLEELTADERLPQAGVQYYYPENNQWLDYQPAYYMGLGPEVTAGKTIAAYRGRVGMVKYAVGGTNLSYDWNPARSGSLYHLMLDTVNKSTITLKSQLGLTARVSAFFWMQGESDSGYPDMANAYETNLRNIIARVRTDFNDPALPFIIGRISNADTWTYRAAVRAAQDKVAATTANVSIFSTDDFTLINEPDPNGNPRYYHYNTRGLVEMGKRFAQNLINLPTAAVLPSTPQNPSVQQYNTFNLTYNLKGERTPAPLTVFVHFMNTAGDIVFQDDHLPPTPTNQWTGAGVSYTRAITLPAHITAGNYKILAGLYDGQKTYPMTPGTGTTDLSVGTFYRYQIGTLSVTDAPDDLPALNALITSAISGGKSEVLLEPRTYKLNCANTAWSFCLNLQNVSTFTIRGVAGQTRLLVATPLSGVLAAVSVHNFGLEDLIIDYETPPFVQGTITNVSGSSITFTTHQISASPDNPSFPANSIFGGNLYPPTGNTLKSNVDIPNDPGLVISAWERLNDGQWKAVSSRANMMSPGDRFAVGLRVSPGIFVVSSSSISFKNVALYTAPSAAFGFTGNTGRIILDTITISQTPGSGRLMSSVADAFHMQNNTAQISLTNSLIQGMGDDAWNTYALGWTVGSKAGLNNNQIRLTDFAAYLPAFETGDQIQVTDSARKSLRLAPDKIAIIQSVETEGTVIKLTLDRSAGDIGEGDFCFPLKFAAQNPVIANNHFGPFRGIFRIHGSGSFTGNTFDDANNANILFFLDSYWNEGPLAPPPYISGNTINGGTLKLLTSFATTATVILQAVPSTATVSPGQNFEITYNWEGAATASSVRAFVHFIDAAGNIVFQDDHQPPVPTNQWTGQALAYTRTIAVPDSAPLGEYKIVSGLYNPGATLQLTPGFGVKDESAGTFYSYKIGTLLIAAPPPPYTILPALLSGSTIETGNTFSLTYNWQASASTTSLQVFTHFMDINNVIVFQDDHQPPTPTNSWSGNIQYTRSVIVAPGIPAGTYKIMSGLYNTQSGALTQITPGTGVATDQTPGWAYQRRYQIGTITINEGPDSLPVSKLSFKVGPAEKVIGPTNDSTADSNLFALKLDGVIRAYTANGNTRLLEGPDIEHLTLKPSFVLQRGAPDSFDGGAWLEAAVSANGKLRGFYHAEKSGFHADTTQKSIAYAESADNGKTFTKIGYPNNQIITGPAGEEGQGDFTVVARHGYLHLYFMDRTTWRTGLARASIESGGVPGSWKKWYNGSFTEPGLGGRFSPLPLQEPNIMGQASYYTPADKFALVTPDPWFGGVRLWFTQNGVNADSISEPLIPFTDAGAWLDRSNKGELIGYTTIVPAQGGTSWSDSFYLFYLYLQPGEDFDKRYIVRRKVDIAINTTAKTPQVRLALSRYINTVSGAKWATTAMVPEGNTFERLLGYIYTKPLPGMTKIMDCYIASAKDYITIPDNCGEATSLRTLGWLWGTQKPGTIAIYRCYNSALNKHLTTTDPACEGFGTQEFPLGYIETITDTEKPVVFITTPTADNKVCGNVRIDINATDNGVITKVELYIDGKLKTTLTAAPYAYLWNTAGLSGTRTLLAKAYDTAGNIGTSTTTTIVIKPFITTTTVSKPVLKDSATIITGQTRSGPFKVYIEPNTFSEQANMTINAVDFTPSLSAMHPRDQIANTTSSGIELILDKPLQPSKSITLDMSYTEAEVTGLNEATLFISAYDYTTDSWLPLQSLSQPEFNKITANSDKLTAFRLMGTEPGTNINAIKVYPNPFYPGRGQTHVSFANLPKQAIIKIYTLQGELIWETETDISGSALWTGKNKAGAMVASGLYLAHIKSGNNKTTIKFSIVR